VILRNELFYSYLKIETIPAEIKNNIEIIIWGKIILQSIKLPFLLFKPSNAPEKKVDATKPNDPKNNNSSILPEGFIK